MNLFKVYVEKLLKHLKNKKSCKCKYNFGALQGIAVNFYFIV